MTYRFKVLSDAELEALPDDGPPDFKLGDCSSCHDSDVLLVMSSNEENPLSYVCKECFLRGL